MASTTSLLETKMSCHQPNGWWREPVEARDLEELMALNVNYRLPIKLGSVRIDLFIHQSVSPPTMISFQSCGLHRVNMSSHSGFC